MILKLLHVLWGLWHLYRTLRKLGQWSCPGRFSSIIVSYFLSCSVSMEKVGLLLSSGWRSLWNWTSLLASEVVLDVKFWGNCQSIILLGCVTCAAWFFFTDGWSFCSENMQTFEGNKLICINRKMECSMCTSQLKMIFLFYVSAGRWPLSTF